GWVVSLIALLYAFLPNVSTSYWIFSVITTQTYLIMYVLMFVAAMRLRRTQPEHPRGYRAPMLKTLCVVGGLASVLAFIIGFVPPSQFSGGGIGYILLVALGVGSIGLLAPAALLYFRRPGWKNPQQEGATGRAGSSKEPPRSARAHPAWLYVLVGAVAAGLAV